MDPDLSVHRADGPLDLRGLVWTVLVTTPPHELRAQSWLVTDAGSILFDAGKSGQKKASAPEDHRGRVDRERGADLHVGLPLSGGQDNAQSVHQTTGERARSRLGRELGLLGRGQNDGRRDPHSRAKPRPDITTITSETSH